MSEKRVVVTGIGALCAFGRDWQTIKEKFRQGKNAVVYLPQLEEWSELEAKLAAPLPSYEAPKHWSRKQLRSMGLVAQYAVDCAEQCLQDAGILDNKTELKKCQNGELGVAAGSSIGSTPDIMDCGMLLAHQKNNFNANTYIRIMPHTIAANIAIFFGLTGRIIPTSSACTSGSQAIGYSYEAIKYGKIPMMLAGGAEQLCPSEIFVFDKLFAASRKNNQPETTPRPYDVERDGLVIGEGACMLLLEELEHAKARGAKIYAEIVGYGANCDGTHITRPNKDTMQKCMKLALQDAKIPASEIAYINAHGTATEYGDIAESQAAAELFGYKPMSCQKSYFGHTLGACGSLEAFFSIEMMRDEQFVPNINLENIDPRCGEVDYLLQERNISAEFVISNNFAFGGVNTSLVLKRWVNN